METIWEIKETYHTYKVSENGNAEEREGWLLECPKGHLLRATSTFKCLDDPVQLCCLTCNELYPVTFKKN